MVGCTGTCFVASKTLQGERRRQERERQAVEMNALEDHSAANLAALTPVLDDAVNQLSAEDRAAILLRFFEQNDFKSVGEALGSNEEAARKRWIARWTSCALLKVRGVTLSGSALAATLAAGSVTAAPAGLAVTITTAALASAAAARGTGFNHSQNHEHDQTESHCHHRRRRRWNHDSVGDAASNKNSTGRGRTRLCSSNRRRQKNWPPRNARLAKLAAKPASAPSEHKQCIAGVVAVACGEVARRDRTWRASGRGQWAETLSGIKANPEMWKLIRDQQKTGMASIYKDFAKS